MDVKIAVSKLIINAIEHGYEETFTENNENNLFIVRDYIKIVELIEICK
mgnify:CR=1 FL=1